jgi:hypothetical protein
VPSLKLLLTITAALAFVFGLGFVALPRLTVAPFGVVLDPAGDLMARFYGAMHLGLGLINWLARDLVEPRGRRAIATGNLVYFALAALVAAGAAMLGTANALILVNAAVFGLLAIAFAPHAVRFDARA